MPFTLIEQLKSARVYDLEQPRFAGMPVFPSHKPGYFYALYRRHEDTYRPEENGPRSGASGVLTMMEHSGTHIDALCHQAYDLHLYGGVRTQDAETPAGFRQLGIEHVPPLLKRGVLLDVAGRLGSATLLPGYAITADDLESTAAAQDVKVTPGDVLLVRTGAGAFWDREADYLAAAGVAKSGTLWAADHEVVAVGADNMAWDCLTQEKDPQTGATLFAHSYLLPQKGVFILENLYLEDLARDRHYVFGFVGIPLKLRGATGSPLRPLALV